MPSPDQRLRDTTRRVVVGAQELTLERGLDGWTMDDLAAHVGVSRRTLFNHVPGKLEAVLAIPCRPAMDDDAVRAAAETFRAGGPTGRLFADMVHLGAVAAALPDPIDTDLMRSTRAVLVHEPRAARAENEHFREKSENFVALVLQREGAAFGADRARLAVRLLLTVFDVAIEQYLDPAETRTLPELFSAGLNAATQLFV